MNKWLSRYIVFRSFVFFMTNPLFYIIFYVTGFFMLDEIPGVRGVWELMVTITNNVFLGGHGEKDLNYLLAFLMPSFIAVAWHLIEKVTGIKWYLAKRGQIVRQHGE